MIIFNRLISKIQEFVIRLIDHKDGRYLRSFYHKKYKISVGKYTYGYIPANIEPGTIIGNFCSIASGVKIGLMNHPLYYVSSHPFLYYASRGFIDKDKVIPQKSSVVIEDDVWIGTNAIILPGVTVHKGAIIGAGAVVNIDVPPYAIFGGVPAKLIAYRFDEKTRESLVEIDWANWNDSEIRGGGVFSFYDPEQFIKKYSKEV